MLSKPLTHKNHFIICFSLIIILFFSPLALAKNKTFKKTFGQVVHQIQTMLSIRVIGFNQNTKDEFIVKTSRKKQSDEKIYFSLLEALYKDNKYTVSLLEPQKILIIKKRFGCVIRSSAESTFNETKHLLLKNSD